MKKLSCMIAFLLLACYCSAQPKYPETKTADSSSTYFGTVYKDPYRWLENFKDASVVNWFKAQASLSDSILNKLNGRDELIAEWKRLDKLQAPRISRRVYEGGRVFYRKTMPGENIGKLYYRNGLNGEEVLLFDPTTYASGKSFVIEEILPSFDGRMVAIAFSEQGAEVGHMRVMDVASRKFLKDDIYPTVFSPTSWSFDNRSLLYVAIKSADNADPGSRLNSKAKLHILGQDPKEDRDYFSGSAYPDLKIDSAAYPWSFVTADSKNYVFASIYTAQPEYELYYAPVAEFNAQKVNWKPLIEQKDKIVRALEVIGDQAFAITYEGAPNYRLIQTNLKNPDWKNAKVIAPEQKDKTLEMITYCKDYLILNHSDGINSHLSKYSLVDGKTTALKLPVAGIVEIYCLDNNTNNITAGISSWNKPYIEYEVDVASGSIKPGIFNKPATYPAAYAELEAREVEVKGHDGAMIPLSIVYRRGTKLDGNNVCLMDGYGASGFNSAPYFQVLFNALVVKGVVFATAHVRGGGEKGDAWYKAGFKTTKPNSWKDFNSCAEYLIAKGYTKPSKLVGEGTSAGGLLISRAITERPDLYAAAICNVGSANAMRMEFGANGRVSVSEFGSVKDSLECKALYEMDGLAHVVPGTKYPAVIGISGWNDPWVAPWETGKFIAALQSANTSGKPVLLKVNFNGGNYSRDKNVTYANFADQFAFAMWQCGHPDFQPKL